MELLCDINQPSESILSGRAAVVIRGVEELSPYLAEWEELAAEAIEPNVFYEPWMLLPALQLLGRGENLMVALVFLPQPNGTGRRQRLCGVFPLQLGRLFRELPAKTLKLWQHKYCFLCTPLIRKSQAQATLAAFFDWLAVNPFKASLVELRDIPGEGPFHQLLVGELNRRGQLQCGLHGFIRPILKKDRSGDAYVASSLSRHRRKETNRLRRRLAETGTLECLELKDQDELSAWTRQFLGLEATGWKGRGGTAMEAEESSREFFVTVTREAFHRKRLMMLGLYLNRRPIAMKCNFLSAPGAFAFKIAYDEEYSRFSPGLQLEIENIHRVHQRDDIAWMDSCTQVQEHFMMNEIWKDFRALKSMVIATGVSPGDFLVSILPLRQWLIRKLRRAPMGRTA